MSQIGAMHSTAAQADAPVHRSCSSLVKRSTDVVLVVGALLLLLPLLFIIAVAIRAETKGPALFRQSRGGLNGRPFTIFKFRTMRVQESGHEVRQARRNDARVTRLGAVLRKTSLDELPQLLNVLLGDMSLVGPRPHALSHDDHYGALVPLYKDRMRVKPGITGAAQVSGLRGETADDDSMVRRVERDLQYIDTWTAALDFKILALTVVKVPFDNRAY